ncbi:MAG: hypothetical protein AB1489_10455 [Acidobacteriota bacterium]
MKSRKEPKEATVGSILAGFFALIAAGALFLGVGVIGLANWIRGQPSTISLTLAIFSLVVGLICDGWAVVRFLRQRDRLMALLNEPGDGK